MYLMVMSHFEKKFVFTVNDTLRCDFLETVKEVSLEFPPDFFVNLSISEEEKTYAQKAFAALVVGFALRASPGTS